MTVSFQTTPSPNFFFAIDHHSRLREVGWLLYPDLSFLAWQAQWFLYEKQLEQNLSRPADVVSVFDDVDMHGAAGASVSMSLPPFEGYSEKVSHCQAYKVKLIEAFSLQN